MGATAQRDSTEFALDVVVVANCFFFFFFAFLLFSSSASASSASGKVAVEARKRPRLDELSEK